MKVAVGIKYIIAYEYNKKEKKGKGYRIAYASALSYDSIPRENKTILSQQYDCSCTLAMAKLVMETKHKRRSKV